MTALLSWAAPIAVVCGFAFVCAVVFGALLEMGDDDETP